MVTARIKIKPYLKEFLVHQYGGEPVRFPDDSYILAFIHELRVKQPIRPVLDRTANIEIVIPYKKYGKDPRQYNHFTQRSQMIIQDKVHSLFCAVMNDYVARKVHVVGLEYREALELFMQEYELDSISYDGLKQKNYRDRNGKRYRRENRFRMRTMKDNFFTDHGSEKVSIVSPVTDDDSCAG